MSTPPFTDSRFEQDDRNQLRRRVLRGETMEGVREARLAVQLADEQLPQLRRLPWITVVAAIISALTGVVFFKTGPTWLGVLLVLTGVAQMVIGVPLARRTLRRVRQARESNSAVAKARRPSPE